MAWCCGGDPSKEVPRTFRDESASEVLGGSDTTVKVIPYETLVQATNDFDMSRKVGDGRFGPVFQGELVHGIDVAVRRLPLNSRQGKRDFAKGVKSMAEAHHRNVVTVVGCSYTNSRLLIHEYLPNGNLAEALFDGKHNLDWRSRMNILLEIANGLAYLHEDCDSIFAHGDIKAANIMLDKIMKPKIADWGLAALFRNDQGEIKPRNMASVGYMSPELALDGHLTAKADVFAFGILCLEVVSGRTNTDIKLLGTEMVNLLSWAWSLQERRQPLAMMDRSLQEYDIEQQVEKVIGIALMCTQDSVAARPSMSRVVAMLKDEEMFKIPAKPEAAKSLGLNDLNVSGTFTSSFVTASVPYSKKISLRWGSRRQSGPSAKLN